MKSFPSRLSRRDFLAGSGLGIAALTQRAPAAAAGKIRVGFLGVAHSHASEKVRVLRQSPHFELVGITAEKPALAAAYERQGLKLLPEEQLLDACEAVIVESAVEHHARDAHHALEHGKHVHVEKPPADSLGPFKELQQLARDQKRLLQVGYMWRFNPAFVAALDAARRGWLGDIYLVRGTMNTLLAPERRPEWGQFKGGAMFEQGCHLIDPLVRLLGRPAAVHPLLKTHTQPADNFADNCVAVFEYPRAQGIITNATLQPNAGVHRFFEILGTNGTATIKPLEPPALTIDLARAAGPYRVGMQTVTVPAYQRYVDEFHELAECIRNGKPLSVAPEEELLVQETLLRACGM